MKSIQTNIINSATLLLQLLNVKITKSTLQNAIEQNPHYPSLFSISDVYSRFKVPNQAFNLASEQFQELEAPFIAFWKNDFVTVTDKSKDAVTFSDFDGKTVTSTIENFLKNYKSIVLVAEPNAESGDPNFNKELKKEKSQQSKQSLLLIGSLLSVTLIFFQFYSFNSHDSISVWFPLLVVLTKITGLSTTVLLLIYEIDKSNALVKNICTAGKQTNCDAVLGSKASHFIGLSWSEIGFYYFASMTIFLFFPGISFINKITFLSIASILVSPYILFSIYYQWKVINRWCPLCLVIQAVLLAELVWALTIYQNARLPFPNANGTLLITILLSIALPIVGWNWIKPLLLKLKGKSAIEAAYKRLLYNPDMFNSLLQQQPEAPNGWQDIGIVVGNPSAKNSILKVCNPYCGPCAKAHPVLEEIIKRNSNYNLKVIFTSTNNLHDRSGVVARHLLAIAEQGNANQTQEALDDWYNSGHKDYEVFSSKYPLNGEIENQKEKVDAMHEWCKEAFITHTPTIFVNGKRLPENYSVNELMYILRNG